MITEIYEEGIRAAQEGKTRADCPYHAYTESVKALAWVKGWTHEAIKKQHEEIMQ